MQAPEQIINPTIPHTALKIILESHIPYVGDTLHSLGRVLRLPPDRINPQAVADADALIVRTRTRCDASLLASSNVRFVATATIGTDHIDIPWCASRGITVVSAPGCNAPAVAQYVWSVILRLRPQYQSLTIGIVGLGNVGSIVADWARRLGMRVLVSDPPRARKEGSEAYTSLQHIAAEADIITFHTPLIKDGPDRTLHLADASFFASLRRKPLIINAARGPVVHTQALVDAIGKGLVADAAVDCWEGEPAISTQLLSLAAVATPHIAGYSVEGKQRATVACVSALYRFAGRPIPTDLPIPAESPSKGLVGPDFASRILASYNPFTDTDALRLDPGAFEQLRNTYPLRHEV